MANFDSILNSVAIITAILAGVGALLATILQLLGKLKEVMEILKPSIKFFLFLGTQIIPNGIIVWVWLYIAAQHADQLTEPRVFLSQIAQATGFIVVYNLIWGIWIYPKLKFLLQKEKNKKKQLGGNHKSNNKNN